MGKQFVNFWLGLTTWGLSKMTVSKILYSLFSIKSNWKILVLRLDLNLNLSSPAYLQSQNLIYKAFENFLKFHPMDLPIDRWIAKKYQWQSKIRRITKQYYTHTKISINKIKNTEALLFASKMRTGKFSNFAFFSV